MDKKYNQVLIDNECQSSSVANDSESCLALVMSLLNDNDNSLFQNSTQKNYRGSKKCYTAFTKLKWVFQGKKNN